jgi:uroporphyrinogen decarboxylase
MMSPRERIKATIHFRKADRLPWYESIPPATLVNWIRQGLPADKITKIEWTMFMGDGCILLPDDKFSDFAPTEYFGIDNILSLRVPLDLGPLPRFKMRIILETDRYMEMIAETGAIARRLKEAYLYNMPMYVSFPVKDRKSWNEYKVRLNPKDSRRYPKDWHKDSYIEIFENYQAGSTVLFITGFYGFGAQLMGIPTFNLMFYKDPELIYDMVSHWEYFTIETIRDAVETLKDRIDLVFWWEDLASRHGPNISPKLYREFLLPSYKRVTNFLKKNKIDRIMMDSDGNTMAILDLAIEAGITGHWPLEVGSGMDARIIRKKYGNKLFLVGNIDKRAVVKGGKVMMEEVESKISVLKETGGYIPGIDHIVPPECTLERFKEYAEYVKKQLLFDS